MIPYLPQFNVYLVLITTALHCCKPFDLHSSLAQVGRQVYLFVHNELFDLTEMHAKRRPGFKKEKIWPDSFIAKGIEH